MAYRGEIITLPIGIQGFCGSSNPSLLGPGHFGYVEGVDLDGDILIKAGGADKINSSPLADGILSGFSWSPNSSDNNDIVVLENGDVLKDTGAGTWATNMGSISPPTVFPPFFVGAGGEASGEDPKLFIFSEADQVQLIDGTSNVIADISTPPADWASAFPIGGVQHENRLWGFGNANDPHRLYYSTTDDHQDFQGTGSGTLSVYPGESRQIVAGISFQSLLLIWKYPRGIYRVDTSDPDTANWVCRRVTLATGGVSPWSVFQISNDAIYLMGNGTIHLLSATQEFGDVNVSAITKAPNYFDVFMRGNVNLSGLRRSMGVWYAAKSKALFTVPQVGSTQNDIRIQIDFNNPQIGPRFLLNRRDESPAIWMRPDSDDVEKPVIADGDGYVWNIDLETRSKDGATYTMEFETSENDFSFADAKLGPRTKNGQFIEIVADAVVNADVTLVPYWDGMAADPVVITIGGTAATLDSFILGTDALAASGIVTARGKLTGSGRRLKLQLTNNEDQEIRISEIRVGFTLADERTVVA